MENWARRLVCAQAAVVFAKEALGHQTTLNFIISLEAPHPRCVNPYHSNYHPSRTGPGCHRGEVTWRRGDCGDVVEGPHENGRQNHSCDGLMKADQT